MNKTHDLAKRTADILAHGLGEQFTYAQIDQRFLDTCQRFGYSDELTDKLFGAWLKLTDHERKPGELTLNKAEAVLLSSVLQRMTMN